MEAAMETNLPNISQEMIPVTGKLESSKIAAIVVPIVVVVLIVVVITVLALFLIPPTYAQIVDLSNLTLLDKKSFSDYSTLKQDLQQAVDTLQPDVYMLVRPEQQAFREKQDPKLCSSTNPTPSFCIALLFAYKVIDPKKPILIQRASKEKGPVFKIRPGVKFKIAKST